MPIIQTSEIPQPWRDFLHDLDQQASETVSLHCLGGFAVTICYGLPRATADIDVASIIPPSEGNALVESGCYGSALHHKHKVYLQRVGIVTLPENYEDRLVELFPGAHKHLRLYALDPYDLALSKLERNIQRDRDDVRYLVNTVPLIREALEDRYRTELRVYIGVPERTDLTLRLWLEAFYPTEG